MTMLCFKFKQNRTTNEENDYFEDEGIGDPVSKSQSF